MISWIVNFQVKYRVYTIEQRIDVNRGSIPSCYEIELTVYPSNDQT